MLTFNTFVFHT
ncbi:hypothetical protein ECTW14301_3586, partial [Escherichia coli TW14301]